ncbi:secreted RxLR effector protein 161-like [Impatiens glandulifera]|uniref:secreted RxLR effector protein 161-like n=1 Tax=Impatiens glandulifera TaxID=253017 RepID=UPI001FB0DB88|nr:secreted RxLR effector protein 161-like [Impatiens glandulifera]
MVSRFMEELNYTHLKAIKRILRYIRGTSSLGLLYSQTKEYKLIGYSNSDWCGDIDDRKSTSGYVFYMGDTTFTWLLKKQPIMTLSTCEQYEAIEIRVDNKSAIELARNLVHHERSKHIDVRFYFIREHVKESNVQLSHVVSRDQVADIFTKALPTVLFENFKRMIGMKDGKDLSLREEFVTQ